MVYIPFVSDSSIVGSAGAAAAASDSSASSGLGVLFARSTVAAFSALLVQSGLPSLTYPTDVTRGIVPKNIHSHNDYWRDVPVLDAISWGCRSIEADIHLINGQLLVGHDRRSLSPERTLQSLYLDPLMQLIKQRNPTAVAGEAGVTYENHIYESDSHPLQLLLDYKTNGTELHAAVLEALQPFRDLPGVLETYNASSPSNSTATGRTPGVLTVTCTGNCPLSSVIAQSPSRDVFIDAPLLELGDPQSEYDEATAGMWSMSWKKVPGSWSGEGVDGEGTKLGEIKKAVERAGAINVPVRLWETPSWPAYKRDQIWRSLLAVSPTAPMYINADNLEAAANL
ncbi:hypothetical protein JCM10207_003994 [Rhodosporidiobolus poonsookiae]